MRHSCHVNEELQYCIVQLYKVVIQLQIASQNKGNQFFYTNLSFYFFQFIENKRL